MGGLQEIAKSMLATMEKKQASRVAGETEARTYDAVFNSAPLGNVHRMNLRGLNLNLGTKQPIRSLGYGATCKVGIRFGGSNQASSEAACQQPTSPSAITSSQSYNIDDPVDKPGVLLASYTWSQEAQRIGTLSNNKSPGGENELKALLIDNFPQLYPASKEEHTSGAFAYFVPGQFRNMYPYPYIIRKDSTHITRRVDQFLYDSKHDPKVNDVLQACNNDEIGDSYRPVPAEFDRAEDVKPLGVKANEQLQGLSKVGKRLRQGALAEEVRLEQGRAELALAEVRAD
ncbi:MAG: hypothetical protein LQ343_002977 [Gyalolechia ehrenbergii]|nr:MAG: hypothetical protein LQ343_002977 [Gyalolechia ehrenbergii]